MSCVLRQVRERLKKDVEQMKLQDPNFRPGLVVLQVSVRWVKLGHCVLLHGYRVYKYVLLVDGDIYASALVTHSYAAVW